MLANQGEEEVESVNKLSSGKSSRIDEASSIDLSILLRWSATRFYAPLLSRISKSNSWSQSIHLISRGFDFAFFNRYLRAAWSVNTTTGDQADKIETFQVQKLPQGARFLLLCSLFGQHLMSLRRSRLPSAAYQSFEPEQPLMHSWMHHT